MGLDPQVMNFCFDYLGFLQEFQMFSQSNFEGLYPAPPHS